MTDTPLLSRLRASLAIALAIALLLGGIGIGTYGEISYRAQKTREVGMQADIVASIVTAALQFDDRKAAQEYVGALAANPEVETAAIYDAAGTRFAAYMRSGATPPRAVPADGSRYDSGMIVAVSPVLENGRRLGSVYLQAESEPFYRRFSRYGLLALLVTMASLLVAVLGTSRAALARANAELGRRADALDAANRSLQAEMQERARVEERLRQAQKMEAIGQLTGGVAHDFNNILQVITGSLERLKRRPDAPRQDRERGLTAALTAAERAAMLTQQLLAFSRQQPLMPASIDVNRLVLGLSTLLSRTLGETIRVDTRLALDLAPAAVDAAQLESALLNLAVNARDAMPQGGRLTIETANVELGAGAAPDGDVPPGHYVRIAVVDNGLGMTPEVLAKAFDPFFTTKPLGRGTGLGLSQVYGFVKQSGGHVEMASEPGRGTRVALYLPRADASDAAGFESDSVVSPPADLRHGTVLVVEDDPDVRAHSANLLRELGYDVLEAEDGAAALSILQAGPAIDLLFTDVGLPGMNGRELAERARRLRPHLKVLFTSGYAQEALVHGGRLDAGVELLAKPFSITRLADKLRDILPP